MNIRQLAGRMDAAQVAGARQHAPPEPGSGARFETLLRQAERDQGLRLSAHARERIEQRGICYDESVQTSIREALRLLESKGAKDALLLRPDAAFVVNVPTQTVVTALNKEDMHHRVFTSIDSAVLI